MPKVYNKKNTFEIPVSKMVFLHLAANATLFLERAYLFRFDDLLVLETPYKTF
jgi:hypothetical protein